MDFGDALARSILVMLIIALAIGIALGGFIFELVPWLYHHISFHWINHG